MSTPALRFVPLTPARWRDVEALFGPAADVLVFTGLASAFERAGFVEVARRSKSRPIMRRQVRGVEDSGIVRAR